MDTNSSLPTTVEAAVRLLCGLVSEHERAKIAQLPETSLVELHFGLGNWVRNNLGLWDANSVLLKATEQANADDASDTIIRAFWQRLRDELPKIH